MTTLFAIAKSRRDAGHLAFHRKALFLLFLFCFVIPAICPLKALANCSSPTGVPGAITYNTTSHVLQYCNGTDWIAFSPYSGAGGAGCTNPSHVEGTLMYNTTYHVMQYCDGTNWRAAVGSLNLAFTDTTPDAFSFTDVTNQAMSTVIYSDTINITGFDGPLVASVTGQGGPQISVNGGAWDTSASINPGDSIQVRLTSSSSPSTALVATVAIGTVSDDWSVTTTNGQTRIFATPGAYRGNLGGLAGADAKCQSAAGGLGYGGTWKALMSDSTTNAKDRVTLVYPVVRASSPSTIVDSSDIWDSSLQNGPGGSDQWTGTKGDGTKNADTCNDWTDGTSSFNGARGDGSYTNWGWVDFASYACSLSKHIYCVDQ